VQLAGSGWLRVPVDVHVADTHGHGCSFDDDVAASATRRVPVQWQVSTNSGATSPI
jgi:hypothetical protein